MNQLPRPTRLTWTVWEEERSMSPNAPHKARWLMVQLDVGQHQFKAGTQLKEGEHWTERQANLMGAIMIHARDHKWL